MDDQVQGSGKPGDRYGHPSEAAKAALARLAGMLSDPTQRQRFKSDPRAACGTGYDELPSSVREAFEKMSDEELAHFGRTCETLADAGFYVEVSGGRLCFF